MPTQSEAWKAGRQGGGEGRTRKPGFKGVMMPLGQRSPNDSRFCIGELWGAMKGPPPLYRRGESRLRGFGSSLLPLGYMLSS